MISKELCNPVKPLPPEEGAFDTYKKYGYFMFPQQRTIYQNIALRIDPHSTVLEVGCGIGLGTALLDRSLTTKVIGTDNLPENVSIARALYPWIKFERYDVCDPTQAFQPGKYDVVVAVEVIEHVEDAKQAIERLCSIALKEVWMSTPNGLSKKKPPDNPYHVYEYTVLEISKMLPDGWLMECLTYDTFELTRNSDPMVYHFIKVFK